MALATVAALVWANSPWWHSYESVWSTALSVRIGGAGIAANLRVWVNEGLMTVFFLVVGSRGQARVRPRRAAGAPTGRDPGAGGARRRSSCRSRSIRRSTPAARARTGGARRCRPTAPSRSGALALLTPRSATRLRVFLLTLSVVDDLVRAGCDRDRLHGARVAGRARGRGRPVRRPRWAASCRHGSQAADGRGGGRVVGRDVQVRHRSGDLGSRRRTRDRRLRALARGSRTRHRVGVLVSRAADAGAGSVRTRGLVVGDLAQRATPVQPAPVGELRDRAAVRARQRRRARDRHAAGRRDRLAGDTRHPHRLCRRQAGRHLRRVLACDKAGAARTPPAADAAHASWPAAPAPGSDSRSRC